MTGRRNHAETYNCLQTGEHHNARAASEVCFISSDVEHNGSMDMCLLVATAASVLLPQHLQINTDGQETSNTMHNSDCLHRDQHGAQSAYNNEG